MDDGIDIRRKQALFRAQRRGFRELDLVFSAFAEKHLPSLDHHELDLFEALLSVPDWEIYGWIVGHAPVPREYDHAVFAALRAFEPHARS